MKRILLALALLSPALAGAQDVRHPWTLQECLDWALEHSLTVKQGELNLAQQEIQTNMLLSRFSRVQLCATP